MRLVKLCEWLPQPLQDYKPIAFTHFLTYEHNIIRLTFQIVPLCLHYQRTEKVVKRNVPCELGRQLHSELPPLLHFPSLPRNL